MSKKIWLLTLALSFCLFSGCATNPITGQKQLMLIPEQQDIAIGRKGIDILLSAVTTDKTPKGVKTAANLTRQILGLRYSRSDEREADLAGLDYMVRAGYNPYGIIETMQMLQNEQKTRPIEFFSTHPAPQNRITYLTQTIQTKYFSSADLKVGKEDYHRSVTEQLR